MLTENYLSTKHHQVVQDQGSQCSYERLDRMDLSPRREDYEMMHQTYPVGSLNVRCGLTAKNSALLGNCNLFTQATGPEADSNGAVWLGTEASFLISPKLDGKLLEGFLTERATTSKAWNLEYFVLNDQALHFWGLSKGSVLGSMWLRNTQIDLPFNWAYTLITNESALSCCRQLSFTNDSNRIQSNEYSHILRAMNEAESDPWVKGAPSS